MLEYTVPPVVVSSTVDQSVKSNGSLLILICNEAVDQNMSYTHAGFT